LCNKSATILIASGAQGKLFHDCFICPKEKGFFRLGALLLASFYFMGSASNIRQFFEEIDSGIELQAAVRLI
jgi:hypothetical protein